MKNSLQASLDESGAILRLALRSQFDFFNFTLATPDNFTRREERSKTKMSQGNTAQKKGMDSGAGGLQGL